MANAVVGMAAGNVYQEVFPLVCVVLIAASAVAGNAQRIAVSPDEAKAWACYTVPLPKSLEIPARVVVPKAQIAIVLPSGDDMVTGQANKELKQTIGLTQAQAANPTFTITLQLGGREAEKLKSLKNSPQAYRIAPELGDQGLRLVALTPTGLYYASKTVQQLLKPRVTDTGR